MINCISPHSFFQHETFKATGNDAGETLGDCGGGGTFLFSSLQVPSGASVISWEEPRTSHFNTHTHTLIYLRGLYLITHLLLLGNIVFLFTVYMNAWAQTHILVFMLCTHIDLDQREP